MSLLHTSLAWAQGDRDRARSLFERGVAAFDEGEYAEALAAFEEAYEIAPHPAVRVNLANCYEQLGRYREALVNYQGFLTESTAATPAQRREVEAAIERLARHFGKIALELSPSDASLRVDGEEVAVTAAPMTLTVGKHVLRASRSGYDDMERVVEVTSGETQSLRMELRQRVSPVAAAPLSRAHDEVDEARQDEERAPALATRDVAPRRTRERRPLLIATGAAAAALGVGWGACAALTYKAQGDFDDASARTNDTTLSTEQRAQAWNDGMDARDRADTLALTSDILLGATVAASAATFVIWMTSRKSEEQPPSVSLAPWGGKSASGLSVRGAF